MQKHVNLVDLVKSFPTNIFLQNLASIQKRTSPLKFAHLAEKSGKGSISNLSTKVQLPAHAEQAAGGGRRLRAHQRPAEDGRRAPRRGGGDGRKDRPEPEERLHARRIPRGNV